MKIWIILLITVLVTISATATVLISQSGIKSQNTIVPTQSQNTLVPTQSQNTIVPTIQTTLLRGNSPLTINTTGSTTSNKINSLEPFIQSQNGLYRLYLQQDGDLIIYNTSNWTSIWNTNTRSSSGRVAFSFGNDGNLTLINKTTNTILWTPMTNITGGTIGSNKLILQNDGNLVLYNDTITIPYWSVLPLPPSNRLNTGACLYTKYTAGIKSIPSEPYMKSLNDIYRLYLHKDGNMIIYNTSTTNWTIRKNFNINYGYSIIWLKFILRNDGDLILYNNTESGGSIIWTASTGGTGGSILILKNDGNLVLYNSSLTESYWSTDTGKITSNIPYSE